MNKKIFALIMMAISMLLITSLANAQEPARVTIWIDKTEYAAGETGTLYFVFYNRDATAVTIKKVTIVFSEWQAYRNGAWEGNQTIDVNQAVASKQIYENNTKFTVPNDGRAKSTFATVTFSIAEGSREYSEDYYISVSQTPRYMEQILTLFTIQVVLIIVCTIIIAATIFLSARRPQITWRKEEEKTE